MPNLSAAGLTPTEAKCYTALLERKDWKPAELAQSVHETRTNVYKVLDNLVALGLAERFDKAKKLHYRAANPTRLLELARERRAQAEQAEKELQLGTEQLLCTYTAANEQAGVRYFQGKEEIGAIFTEIADAGSEVVFINTEAGIKFYDFETMHRYRMLAPTAGVWRRALTPDLDMSPADYKTADPQVLLKRTWLKHGDYTAPVEWGAFDDKLYLISYGTEALGMIIESRQIADSFKQLFKLLERGQKLLPDYATLPRLAASRGRTD